MDCVCLSCSDPTWARANRCDGGSGCVFGGGLGGLGCRIAGSIVDIGSDGERAVVEGGEIEIGE